MQDLIYAQGQELALARLGLAKQAGVRDYIKSKVQPHVDDLLEAAGGNQVTRAHNLEKRLIEARVGRGSKPTAPVGDTKSWRAKQRRNTRLKELRATQRRLSSRTIPTLEAKRDAGKVLKKVLPTKTAGPRWDTVKRHAQGLADAYTGKNVETAKRNLDETHNARRILNEQGAKQRTSAEYSGDLLWDSYNLPRQREIHQNIRRGVNSVAATGAGAAVGLGMRKLMKMRQARKPNVVSNTPPGAVDAAPSRKALPA